jgi:hypothetical protein
MIVGDQLYEKLARAICDSVVFFEAYRTITNSLARDRPDDLRHWLLEVEGWEADQAKPCPYDAPRKSKISWNYHAATHLTSMHRDNPGRGKAGNGSS